MFRFKNWRKEEPKRVYAVGDIHGRLDLFQRLIAIIKRDHASRVPAPTRIILLGDLIDRGPDSATLVRWCRQLTDGTDRFVVLKGNHEAMMVGAIRDADFEVMEIWLQQGGDEALASWGVPRPLIAQGASVELLHAARRAVDADTLKWMAALPLTSRHEDHLFVHAGIRPGVPLKRQQELDLLWIRNDFLDSKEDHGCVVVHGHSVHESGPDVRRNRIGIDSGAYRTGRLTAIGLEDGQFWPLMTERAKVDPSRKQARSASDPFVDRKAS